MLLSVIALVAIFVLSLLGQVVDYVGKSGLNGVIDRVWQGVGGGKEVRLIQISVRTSPTRRVIRSRSRYSSSGIAYFREIP